MSHAESATLGTKRQSYTLSCTFSLFEAKPFSEYMLVYCQLDPKEYSSIKSFFEKQIK